MIEPRDDQGSSSVVREECGNGSKIRMQGPRVGEKRSEPREAGRQAGWQREGK